MRCQAFAIELGLPARVTCARLQGRLGSSGRGCLPPHPSYSTSIVVQEWIEGPDTELYFCLQYVGAGGDSVCSFTGRKLSIWPPDVGVTASCTAAPEARSILQSLTDAFFRQLFFVGMGGIEFKRDVRTGRFVMIEPSVGRIDGQEEVATLHGANIPLAAYLYETGRQVPRATEDFPVAVWRDGLLDRMSARRSNAASTVPNGRVYDAYWRPDDPTPILFHLLLEAASALRRAVRRVPVLHRLARALKRSITRDNRQRPASH